MNGPCIELIELFEIDKCYHLVSNSSNSDVLITYKYIQLKHAVQKIFFRSMTYNLASIELYIKK